MPSLEAIQDGIRKKGINHRPSEGCECAHPGSRALLPRPSSRSPASSETAIQHGPKLRSLKSTQKGTESERRRRFTDTSLMRAPSRAINGGYEASPGAYHLCDDEPSTTCSSPGQGSVRVCHVK